MLKIERIFNDNSSLNLSDIMNSLITEYIENHFVEHSNSTNVNLTTTHKINAEGAVA